jgi:hypothetical protein
MRNDTYDELERIANKAGRDGVILLLPVSRRAERKDLSRRRMERLSDLASSKSGFSPILRDRNGDQVDGLPFDDW